MFRLMFTTQTDSRKRRKKTIDTKEIANCCDQIVSAAMSVYIKGCDDVAISSMAQLRGICAAADRIKSMIKEDKPSA